LPAADAASNNLSIQVVSQLQVVKQQQWRQQQQQQYMAHCDVCVAKMTTRAKMPSEWTEENKEELQENMEGLPRSAHTCAWCGHMQLIASSNTPPV
jgi:hypothetical protein